jgi:predicted NAD/FAD-binding protein
MMKTPSKIKQISSQLTRRHIFKAGALGSIMIPWAMRSTKAKAAPAKKLAIIGGGMGGVASAYFASDEWAIDLYESEPRIGGHGDTRRVMLDGKDHPVDMGADFFHPATHPLYWSFLEHIGIRTPNDKSRDLTIETNATLNIFDKNSGKSIFNSINPYVTPIKAVSFLTFTEAARLFVTTNTPFNSFDITVGQWLDLLPVPNDFKREVLTPWVSSISCSDTAEVRRQSARSHFSVVAGSFPVNPFQKIVSYNAAIGTGGFINLMSSQCEFLTIKLNAPVSNLENVDGKWFVTSSEGRVGPYDAVVVNAPPHISKNFFSDVKWAAPLVDILASQEYYEAKVAVHSDPVYMPKEKKLWGIQNVAIDDQSGEASIYVGGIFEKINGKKISLFKSWTAKRNEMPREILAERTYFHPLTTPEFLDAARQLKDWQGKNGLYFSGHFTTNTDLQETALYSALETAKRLYPESTKLLAFRAKLAKENLLKVNYEVP